MPSIVRIADPTGSTPRPLSLLAVGIGGVIAGLLLVQLSLAAPRPEARGGDGAGADEDTLAVDHAPPDAEGPGARGAGGASGDDEAEDADADDAAGSPADALEDDLLADTPTVEGQEEPGPEADPADATATAPTGETTPTVETDGADGVDAAEEGVDAQGGPARALTRGRVAYFGCPSDRCSRDHGLERDVFRALERVTGCMGGAGEGDVRVTIEGGAITEVRFRERGTEGLAIPTLDRCLTPPLRRITGSVLPNGVVVSFRFDVL